MIPSASPPARQVQHLHVRAGSPTEVERVRFLVEDALRTATFPGEHGGTLLIRRLALGRIARHVSAPAVALQLERRVRDLISSAVSFESFGALHANAVVIPSRAAGLIRLAQLSARGQRLSEWFWSKLVPGWDPDSSAGERWLRLLNAAHDPLESPLVPALVVNEIVSAGKAIEMLRAISPRQARDWLHATGFRLEPSQRAYRGPTVPVPRLTAPIPELAPALHANALDDDRTVWLTTLLTLNRQPSQASNQTLPIAMRRALDAILSPSGTQETESAKRRHVGNENPTDLAGNTFLKIGSPERVRTKTARRPPDPTPRHSPATTAANPTRAIPDAGKIPIAPSRRESDVDLAREFPESVSPLDSPAQAEISPHAGLLFLVPVLERLGFAEWLAKQPQWLAADFPYRLFRFLGNRVGLKPEDPLYRVFEPASEYRSVPRNPDFQKNIEHPTSNTQRRRTDLPPIRCSELNAECSMFAALCDSNREAASHSVGSCSLSSKTNSSLSEINYWPDAVESLLKDRAPHTCTRCPFDVWHHAVRRWCRRKARIGLASLICRRGWVNSTRTHLEISFALSQLDLRVRLMALDVDPGWVPWLGLVIRFRYGEESESLADN